MLGRRKNSEKVVGRPDHRDLGVISNLGFVASVASLNLSFVYNIASADDFQPIGDFVYQMPSGRNFNPATGSSDDLAAIMIQQGVDAIWQQNAIAAMKTAATIQAKSFWPIRASLQGVTAAQAASDSVRARADAH
jgi:hypothetical protein